MKIQPAFIANIKVHLTGCVHEELQRVHGEFLSWKSTSVKYLMPEILNMEHRSRSFLTM